MKEVSDEEFIALWNAGESLASVIESVCEHLATRVPRWAVMARAIELRNQGRDLKPFPNELKAQRSAAVELLTTVRDNALTLMADHGLSQWSFAFNNNVRRAGVCKYPTRVRPGRIELSRHFVLRNDAAEVNDTILHEIAHALVGQTHGHDAVWKAKARALGARPERCYGEEIAMPKGRWRAKCPGCAKEFDRHRRPVRLTGWHCKSCGKDRGSLRWQAAI